MSQIPFFVIINFQGKSAMLTVSTVIVYGYFMYIFDDVYKTQPSAALTHTGRLVMDQLQSYPAERFYIAM